MNTLIEEIAPLRDMGYISTQVHPNMPLMIHNYTQRCQFDRHWNTTTLDCRGLITDMEGNIVCRPFPKFFNVEEHEAENSPLPELNWNQSFTVTEKMDGSLGILYESHDGLAIATRGSFTSEQAVEATRIFREKYGSFKPIPWCTYLFEIIYP